MSTRFSLSGKTIAITGGGRGLGITLAQAVVEAGGHVACLDILPEPVAAEWTALEKTAAAGSLSCTYHHCDVTSETGVEAAIEVIAAAAKTRGAELAGVVACAGIQQKTPALDYPAADFERMLRVNVTGVFVTAKHAARVMVREGTRGSVVLIASMSGEIANRGLTCTAYNSSKAAVQQMCRSLAQEWGQYGIRVNTLSPGYIRTAMTDDLLTAEPSLEKTWMAGALLGRLGVPEDFMAPAVFLLADGSSFMTGADLRVDGGDERKPSCSRCSRVDEACQWGVRVEFRSMNPSSPVKTSAETAVNPCSPVAPSFGTFKIIDLTESVICGYEGRKGPQASVEDKAETTSTSPTSSRPRYPTPGQSSFSGSFGVTTPDEPVSTPLTIDRHSRQWTPTGTAALDQSISTITSHPPPRTNPSPMLQQAENAAANLLSLRDSIQILPRDDQPPDIMIHDAQPSPEQHDFGHDGNPPGASPGNPFLSDFGYVLNNEGSLLPGPTYLDLHTTLRDRLIQESRSTQASRRCSPCSDCEEDEEDGNQRVEPGDHSFSLKPEEEYLLWKNWLDEVSPWLDKFDHSQHFKTTLSYMAQTHIHLRYSIMAVSARQMERQRGAGLVPIPSSLALYQQAIHHLLPKLATRSTDVIASCVILCVLEMLSCSPKAWQRHLDGCATLLQAVGINGFSGGVEQALFWCFARMDLVGGLISSVKTLIPVRLWTPEADLRSALDRFRNTKACDMYANQIVFLGAHVVDFLDGAVPKPNANSLFGKESREDDQRIDPAERWQELWEAMEDWFSQRPFDMQAVFTSCSGNAIFPTILFSDPAAISGNQMYHTIALLLLQHRPSQAQQPPRARSILWHARRIIGISLSNTHHGCWTNSLQPIWIAGRCLSSPDEHRVVLDLLAKIERESGWATAWRADDLREWWGDLGD